MAATAVGTIEEKICRFCLDAGDEDLRSVCGCRGSQQWVHLSCLRQWQISAQTSVNHPDEVRAERRHLICNVCKEPFQGVPAPNRTDLVAAMAGISPVNIRPGTLLRYANMFPAPQVEDSAMQILFDCKKAHFHSSVYLVTSVEEGGSSSDDCTDAAIFGINLVRDAAAAWAVHDMALAERTRGALSDEQVAAWQHSGVQVQLALGGPVAPKKPCFAVLVSSDEPEGWAMGEMQEMASRAARAARSRRGQVLLRIFFGYGRWSRSQLLGEIARGSWGVALSSSALAEELAILPESDGGVWHKLAEDAGRLHWAPPNPMREDYERRSQRVDA